MYGQMYPFIPPPATEETQPAAIYAERMTHFTVLRNDFTARSDRQGLVNVALFFGALLAVLVGFFGQASGWYWLAAVLFVGFVGSFAYHTRIDEQRRRYRELVFMQAEAQARLSRDWAQMPLPRYPEANDPTHIARDLDLVGHASLLHLLGTARTPVGLATLQGWVLRPATVATAHTRQGQVRELAARPDFRDALAVEGRLMGDVQRAFTDFATWAGAGPLRLGETWLRPLSIALPIVTFVLVAVQLVGWVNAPLWLLPVVVNAGLTLRYGKAAHTVIEGIADNQSIFERYAALFERIAAQDFADAGLRALQARLGAGGVSAAEQMRRLGRLMPWVQLRRWPFYILIQVFSLVLFHTAWVLDDWRQRVGARVSDWLAALGEMEALCALATLAHDQPTWAMPECVEEGTQTLTATDLGHPLLPPTQCVGNDVVLGPPGTFVLVTGSNMSGKSTLLRAVGVNVTLAQMGGPVCANVLRLPPVELATSIRISDSLESGVSYFMAELRQLKSVVDRAEAAQQSGGPTVLFLLDEILHGTNTTERQIAARRIIRHLLDVGAMGAVSTHDLTLGDVPELLPAETLVHFTEDFTRVDGKPMMRFDYRLRPGLATSSNALKLMEIVGLPAIPDAESPSVGAARRQG
jgi:hypothetical protein